MQIWRGKVAPCIREQVVSQLMAPDFVPSFTPSTMGSTAARIRRSRPYKWNFCQWNNSLTWELIWLRSLSHWMDILSDRPPKRSGEICHSTSTVPVYGKCNSMSPFILNIWGGLHTPCWAPFLLSLNDSTRINPLDKKTKNKKKTIAHSANCCSRSSRQKTKKIGMPTFSMGYGFSCVHLSYWCEFIYCKTTNVNRFYC